MMSYSVTSARSSDGAENQVVMIGKNGYLGYSTVRLQYLDDGWIKLTGDNIDERNGWKLLSNFTLKPGRYTLTGMKDSIENTIVLQLRIQDDTGYYHYFYQWDEDVSFTVEREAEATLNARVYPEVEGIDIVARPAVYKDE